jgi:hypothetical protein
MAPIHVSLSHLSASGQITYAINHMRGYLSWFQSLNRNWEQKLGKDPADTHLLWWARMLTQGERTMYEEKSQGCLLISLSHSKAERDQAHRETAALFSPCNLSRKSYLTPAFRSSLKPSLPTTPSPYTLAIVLLIPLTCRL